MKNCPSERLWDARGCDCVWQQAIGMALVGGGVRRMQVQWALLTALGLACPDLLYGVFMLCISVRACGGSFQTVYSKSPGDVVIYQNRFWNPDDLCNQRVLFPLV